MNWVFEHSQDDDFATPLDLGGKGGKKSNKTDEANPESIGMLLAMGFTDQQARHALKKNVSEPVEPIHDVKTAFLDVETTSQRIVTMLVVTLCVGCETFIACKIYMILNTSYR